MAIFWTVRYWTIPPDDFGREPGLISLDRGNVKFSKFKNKLWVSYGKTESLCQHWEIMSSPPHTHPFQISYWLLPQHERVRKQEYPFMDVVPILTGVVSTKSISINTPLKKLWISSFKTVDNQRRNRFSWGEGEIVRREGRKEAEVLSHSTQNWSWKRGRDNWSNCQPCLPIGPIFSLPPFLPLLDPFSLWAATGSWWAVSEPGAVNVSKVTLN